MGGGQKEMDGYAAFYMKVKVIKQKVEIRKSSRNRSLRWGGGQKEMDGYAARWNFT